MDDMANLGDPTVETGDVEDLVTDALGELAHEHKGLGRDFLDALEVFLVGDGALDHGGEVIERYALGDLLVHTSSVGGRVRSSRHS